MNFPDNLLAPQEGNPDLKKLLVTQLVVGDFGTRALSGALRKKKGASFFVRSALFGFHLKSIFVRVRMLPTESYVPGR